MSGVALANRRNSFRTPPSSRRGFPVAQTHRDAWARRRLLALGSVCCQLFSCATGMRMECHVQQAQQRRYIMDELLTVGMASSDQPNMAEVKGVRMALNKYPRRLAQLPWSQQRKWERIELHQPPRQPRQTTSLSPALRRPQRKPTRRRSKRSDDIGNPPVGKRKVSFILL